jgi:NADH:ubiquinone oxidoreductase subunit E
MPESKAQASTDNWPEIRRQSAAALPDDIVKLIDELRGGEHPESHLIGVLHKVQAHYGHLGQPQMDAVAHLLGVPAAKVSGVATFYHFFRLTPRGRYVINVCMGTACYVRGADKIVDKLHQELGIDFGQTTSDGLFSLEASRCLGTCGLAPILMVNDDVHAKVTPDQVPGLLDKYARQAHAKRQAGGRGPESQ